MFSSLVSKSFRVSLVLASSLLLASCDRLLTPDFNAEIQDVRSGQYTLDKDHAAMNFKINHLGFSTFIGSFDNFDAALDFDPENIANASLEVVVDMNSLDVNLPEFEVELKGENWFDVAQFPQAIFRTTSYVGTTENEGFQFNGELTMHGVTAPVTIDVNFHGGGRNVLTRSYTLGFSGSTKFLRSAFGVDRFTNFGVADEVELEVHVEFQAANPT